MKLFLSSEEREAYGQRETVTVAWRNGFDTETKNDDGSVVCGKHSTAEVVEVYPNGNWEYRNTEDDDNVVKATGLTAALLGMFFAHPDVYLAKDDE